MEKNSIVALLENNIATGVKETHQLSDFIQHTLLKGGNKDSLIQGIQASAEGMENETIFLSIFDWSGKIVSYPDRNQLGKLNEQESTLATKMESLITGEELYAYMQERTPSENNLSNSEVFYLKSIPGSDWNIASHIDFEKIQEVQVRLRNQMYLIFIIIGLTLLLFVAGALRFVRNYYSKQLEIKAEKLEDGVLNLTKLNDSLDNYQKEITAIQKEQEIKAQESIQEKTTEVTDEKPPTEVTKQRILTYVRNELKPIATEDIAYIYVDNTITYVIDKNGKRSTTNDSLDNVFSSLDDRLFFRANRQIIVAIHAIDKITKYGNSALKIQTSPISEIDIVIGKNKAASFKQWLDL